MQTRAISTAPNGRSPLPADDAPWRFPWELAVVLAFQVLFLLPTLRTGYIADDAINSSFTGALQLKGVSAWDAANSVSNGWVHNQGRWAPLGFYWAYGEWHLLHSLLAYKLLQIAAVLVAGSFTWVLLRRVGYGRAAAALAVLLAGVVIQLRVYYDPILSFTQGTAIVWCLYSGSLILFALWLRRRKFGWLAGSLVLLFLACATYEGPALMFPLFWLVAWRLAPSLRGAARAAIAPTILSLAFLVLGAVLRSRASAGAGGPYAPSFNLKEVVFTTTDQFLAAVPLSYRIFDPSNLFPNRLDTNLPLSIAIGLAAALCAWLILRRCSAPEGLFESSFAGRRNLGWLAAFGAAVVILTGSPIGIAARYQDELVAGLGHIQVFFGYIGVGMIGAALTIACARAIRGGLIVAAVVIGVIAAVTFSANQVVVESYVPIRQMRDTETSALKAGLFAGVTPGSTLYPAQVATSPWEQDAFYRLNSGVPLAVKPPWELYPLTPATPKRAGCDSDTPGRVFASHDTIGDRGYTALTCVDYGGRGLTHLYLRNLEPNDLFINAELLPHDGRPARKWGASGQNVLNPVAGRPGIWRLVSPSAINPQSLSIIF